MRHARECGQMRAEPRWLARLLAGMALAALLGLAGCGQETTVSGVQPKPTATLTPTPVVSPTPISYPQQWQAASGLPATVGGYAFAQSSPQTGYACVLSSNGPSSLWTTTDGGQTWSALPPFSIALGAQSCDVNVDPTNPQDVFVWDSVSLIRSQDGGHTWTSTAPLFGQTGPSAWANATSIGNRIIATSLEQRNNLFASDDDGKTWDPIGQSIAAQNLNVGNFITVGQTLYVSGYPSCAGGPPIDGCQGDALAALRGGFGGTVADAHAGTPALYQPLSGDRPVPYRYFASTDGGKTFTELKVPGAAALSELSFTPKASGGGFYGVVLSTANDLTSTVYWSNDSGHTWQAMPQVDASTPGQPDPTAFGIMGRLIVCPDGTIVAGAWAHRFPADGDGDLGFYQIPGGIAFAHWQPLAAGGFFRSRAIPQGTGFRLWGLRYTGSLWQGGADTQSGDTLESVTFQQTS